MTELHARLDLLEGNCRGLVGAAAGLHKRAFAVLSLMRGDGTTGMGEASPLPGYSPDSIEEATAELRRLVDGPVRVDPLVSPLALLDQGFAASSIEHPSSRFALETALLDWLGRTRNVPLHRMLAGDVPAEPIRIADLVLESDPRRWAPSVDRLVSEGATHLKLKVGVDLDQELRALRTIRRSHPSIALRLDGNRRIPLDSLRRHAATFEALELELFEEPVADEDWPRALALPLPYALDESLRNGVRSGALLETGKIRAVVLKPMVLGGLRRSLELAEHAATFRTACLVSHTFDGPISRAATAELALVLRSELAAGLSVHPGLDLWSPHRIAAIRGREIVPHDAPGLGIEFEGHRDA